MAKDEPSASHSQPEQTTNRHGERRIFSFPQSNLASIFVVQQEQKFKTMPKSTENTVFVRFVPTPTHKLRRHQLEAIFSEAGPIKKTSWIHSNENTSKGYGFVKYMSNDDAKAASLSLNNSKIQLDGIEYKVLVEVASVEQNNSDENHHRQESFKASHDTHKDISNEILKKKSRVILRNLSFYAKENHVRAALEKKYGEIVDVHLPQVQSNMHVGFCFVTFANPDVAQRAISDKQIEIQNRTALMEWSMPKAIHQQVKKSESVSKETDDSRILPTESTPDGKEDSVVGERSDVEVGSPNVDHIDDSALKEERTIFIRNLPFDVNRNDLLHLFGKFGHIESIYLVKDKVTGMTKGTAFLTYKRGKSAKAAIEMASSLLADQGNRISSSLKVPAVPIQTQDSSIVFKGRKILIDYAVDKETAGAFDSKEQNASATDRRNIYLQTEGRVESTPTEPGSETSNTWEDIPEQDQKKRQAALKDKTTKLQSPIFFINPLRLSIRNLAKHIDEAELRNLCEKATKKGLLSGLVKAKDYIAHLRAQGQMTTREILGLIQEKGKNSDDIITPWEENKNTKDYIPSVYVDRDYSNRITSGKAPSRGFGFVEFTHHVHALACLRELNNNPLYSSEYVAGGKSAAAKKGKGKKTGVKGIKKAETRIPRLIVDFTVGRYLYIKSASSFFAKSLYSCIFSSD